MLASTPTKDDYKNGIEIDRYDDVERVAAARLRDTGLFAVTERGDREPRFVMSLQLDERSFGALQDWRLRYFPSMRNHIPAHLTLFHTLSDDQVSRLRASWKLFESLSPVEVRYAAPRFLGTGVAIDVESDTLRALRRRLVDVVSGSLSRQDRQPFRAHVTIQNKVEASEARALHDSLSSSFEPWCGVGTAVLIWRYLGGPWALEWELPFRGQPAVI